MLALNRRILIVDDNASIHEDYRKILGGSPTDESLASDEALLFGDRSEPAPAYELTHALQGEEAIALVRTALAAARPFALAFVDIRMPPGIDGVETVRRIWAIDPDLPVVICSAYSDYSWSDMATQLGEAERWILLKKPFETIEVLQMAAALGQKRTLQQAARARQAELEQRVAERTAKLTAALAEVERGAAAQARADEARRALEHKVEAAQRLESLGVLAGGIAHDFNNILTGIVGRASLARLGATARELDDHLGEIEVCARRAAELCEQMLAYAGQSRVTVRDVELNAVVREITGLLRATVPRDVQLRVDLGPAAADVRGDPTRLRQVVMNLVLNGVEALGDGVREVRLATAIDALSAADLAAMTFAGEAAPGSFVVLHVADTGAGMTPETVRRIFEPFFTTKFDGRGLGLCAVLGIVRSHGGALDVASTPGRGTVFRVCLPLLAPKKAIAPVPPVAEPVRPASAPRGRLLVADDEECVRTVAAYSLRRHGYVVEVACDGLEAVERVRLTPEAIDGLIIDLTMPRMSGTAALRAIRKLRPDLPAVIISGYGQKDTLGEFANSPCTVALEKPFDVDRLYQTVAGLLRSVGK